jgi:hypothetical protein
VILVRPEGAKVEDEEVFDETCGRADPLYYGKGPGDGVFNSDERRRFSEHAIALHSPLYVMGYAREREDVVAPVIVADESAPIFLISCRDEKRITGGLGVQFWVFGMLGLAVSIAGWVVRAAMGEHRQVEPYQGPCAITAAGFLALWLLCWVWLAFNAMVRLRQMVRQAWSNVDVQLRRRSDLIPPLVEAVKGLRGHERTVQESLALLRCQAEATRPGQPGPDPAATYAAIVGIVERYPELTANEAFTQLQKQLGDTENRIALAREYFNSIASHYNQRLAVMPDSLIASLGSFPTQPFFAAAGFERQPVPVELAN